MFKYNNTHIFTGYLKQLLASFNLPNCKVYTQEFADYLEQHGEEDPRVLESFDTISKDRLAVRVNYLKNNEVCSYFSTKPDLVVDYIDATNKTHWKRNSKTCTWKQNSEIFYNSEKAIYGLTRTLRSSSDVYDVATHEYLGDYLRFLRDYYNINLMSLYNCFNNNICNNISQDSNYRIYAIPVKLFAEYTVAIDCNQGIEMFCGFYNTSLEVSTKASNLTARTYTKVNKTLFSQPFLFDKLSSKYWNAEADFTSTEPKQIRTDVATRWDVTNREKDLKLFIKVPVSCKSSIVILEGDYRAFNDCKYIPINYKKDGSIFNSEMGEATPDELKTIWKYYQNHSVLNFNARRVLPLNTTKEDNVKGDGINLNEYKFKPIGKLQLLAFNTGESYPFADRLVEYLSGSVITPIDPIPDNIKRTQRVMEQNNNYFDIEGIWENKMQNLIYDYVTGSGPIECVNEKLRDKRQGYYRKLGHNSKSTLYDILGYVDKDVEKWYASWTRVGNKAQINNTIQNVDIYEGMYDIE